MKKDQIQIGRVYLAKVSGNLSTVKIDRESPYGGWDATNTVTNRKVRIKSAMRLRREVNDLDARPLTSANTECPHCHGLGKFPACAGCGQKPSQAPDGTIVETVEEPSPTIYDPDKCATKRCRSAPVMTHLGRPLCNECWEMQAENEADMAKATPVSDAEAPLQEIEMSATKTKKRSKDSKKKTLGDRVEAAATKRQKKNPDRKPKEGLSMLDAAAQVMQAASEPMRCQDVITKMSEKGLWTSPGGKTPHATLYAAMTREIGVKGKDARFKKVDKGLFATA